MADYESRITPENMQRMHDTLGLDLTKFIIASRKRGELGVIQSSEGATPSRSRLEYIQRLMLEDSIE